MQLPTFQSSSSSDEARIITDSCCREFYDHLREIINDKLRRIGNLKIFLNFCEKKYFLIGIHRSTLIEMQIFQTSGKWDKISKSCKDFLKKRLALSAQHSRSLSRFWERGSTKITEECRKSTWHRVVQRKYMWIGWFSENIFCLW